MTAAPKPSPEPKRSRLKLGLAIGWGLIGVAGLVALLTVRPRSMTFDGPSMSPTIRNGQTFNVRKHRYGIFGPPEVREGDVVLLRNPADGVQIVKRVIAVGGEEVEVRDGRIHVQGTALAREEVACPESGPGDHPWPAVCTREGREDRTWVVGTDPAWAEREHPALVIPEGSFYVLGDYRDHSNDSRNPLIGPVPHDAILGIVKL